MINIIIVGQSISKVHFVLKEEKKLTSEAFVMFENVLDVELALEKVDGRKLQNVHVKVFRSSVEQFRHHCDPTTTKNINQSESLQNGRINSVPNLGEVFSHLYVKYC